MKRLLVLNETATLLRCSKKTVYRLISEGELEALHVRGTLRVTHTSVDFYISRQIESYQEKNGLYKYASAGSNWDK